MKIPDSWIKKSPFKTREKLNEVLKKYKRGESIGFTYTSSLKSMGILPRSSGKKQIGKKYSSDKKSVKTIHEILIDGFNQIGNISNQMNTNEKKALEKCFILNRRNQFVDQNISKFKHIMDLEFVSEELDNYSSPYNPLLYNFYTEDGTELFKTIEHFCKQDKFTLSINVKIIYKRSEELFQQGHRNQIVIHKENKDVTIFYIEPHGEFLKPEIEIRRKIIQNVETPEIKQAYEFSLKHFPENHLEFVDPLLVESYISSVFSGILQVSPNQDENVIYKKIKQSFQLENNIDFEKVNKWISKSKHKELNEFLTFLLHHNAEQKKRMKLYHDNIQGLRHIRSVRKLQNNIIELLQKHPELKKYNLDVKNPKFQIQLNDQEGFCTTISSITYFLDKVIKQCFKAICLKRSTEGMYVPLFERMLQEFVYQNTDVTLFGYCTNKKDLMCPFNIFFTIFMLETEKNILSKETIETCQIDPRFFEIVNQTVEEIREHIESY